MSASPLPALPQLHGIITVIENRAGLPADNVLASVRALALDAIELLEKAASDDKRRAFVLLCLQESTEVAGREVNGKLITRVTVKDQTLYAWSMAEIHRMANAA